MAEEDEFGTLPAFKFGRNAIMRNILTNAAVQLDDWGIELLGIRRFWDGSYGFLRVERYSTRSTRS